MNTFSKLTAFALVSMIASTSVTLATDIYGPFGTVILQDPFANVPQAPVTPQIPIVNNNGVAFVPLGPAKPVTPNIPIINNNGGPVVPIGSYKPQNNQQHDDIEMLVDCAVPGLEFAASNDLLIKNLGSDDLPAGIKLKFRVRSTGDHGAFQLPKTIKAGKHLVIAGMLHGAIAGAPCDADILI